MDERFEFVKRDHRFRPIRQAQRKIQIDKRFHGIFFNKNFRENFTVDKRGRPIRESSAKNLRKFYHLSKAERKRIHKERVKDREALRRRLECEEEIVADKLVQDFRTSNNGLEKDGDDLDSKDLRDFSDESDSESSYIDSEDDSDVDLARGKGNIESSSDEEEETDDDSNLLDHGWGEMDQEAPRAENTSHRLALCSMDWDRVNAADIFVLLDSFKPSGGIIKSVTVYPSEFGMKRLAQEEKSGPAELKEMRSDNHEDEWTKADDEQYNTEKLRQYQLNRLKYYYAVIICDSVNTAEKIYKDCDGIEFETSCSKIDLRFIPDGMEFSDYPPKEKLTSAPDLLTYKPALFITAALNQTKVGLTWDETDHKRTAITKNSFSREELESMDVKDFLASSSGSEKEDEDEEERPGDLPEQRSKMDENERAEMYRKLLLEECEEDENKKREDVDMEITWEPDLKEKVEESILGAKQKRVKKRESSSEDEIEDERTTQAELEMVMLGDEGNLSGVKGNMKDFKLDVSDERFSALYKSSKYAIDRSDSAFKESSGMATILRERQERMERDSDSKEEGKLTDNSPILESNGNELDSLVKSVKSKSAWFGKKNKRAK